MTLFRPQDMVWVDLLIDRDSVQEAIRLLAAHNIIELRNYARTDQPFEIRDQSHLLQRLGTLREKLDRYRGYLPEPVGAKQASTPLEPTAEALPAIEAAVLRWLDGIERPASELERESSRLEENRALHQCIAALPATNYDLGYFISLSRSHLYSSFIALGDRSDSTFFRDTDEQVLFAAYPLARPAERFVFIGVIAAPRLPELERAGHLRGIRFLSVPAGIEGVPPQAAKQLQTLNAASERRCASLREEIERIARECDIATAVWNLQRHVWLCQVLERGLSGTRFVWLGGWVASRRFQELLNVLESGGIPFLVNRNSDDEHGLPPALLDNPGWMRSFEVFVRGFGLPAHGDVDPTPLLALTTPLMFGYMFGDVGHGVVLVIAGWLLRARLPVLALLIPAGVVSVVFGFLFGSVFCDEHAFAPLWLQPMSEPLTILGVPLLFGFLFLTVAMVLAGVQARWHAGSEGWWRAAFPVLLVYSAGLPLAIWDWRIGGAVAVAGALWYVLAKALGGDRERSLVGAAAAAAAGVLEFLETTVQLLVNTLSFVRLGAFALAHSGLSSAVMALAELSDTSWIRLIVLIVGNVVVLALEGLVVSIQTTRLVLFEFFRRFYSGQGDEFKPLSLPANQHSVSDSRR